MTTIAEQVDNVLLLPEELPSLDVAIEMLREARANEQDLVERFEAARENLRRVERGLYNAGLVREKRMATLLAVIGPRRETVPPAGVEPA